MSLRVVSHCASTTPENNIVRRDLSRMHGYYDRIVILSLQFGCHVLVTVSVGVRFS